MSDLLNRVRAAQVEAGELAVIEHLREIGIMSDELTSTSTPTSGPWKVIARQRWTGFKKSETVYEISQDRPDGGWRIAEVVFPGDARLIASAPDLLEVVEALLIVAKMSPPGMVLDENSPLMDAARAAIARAKGA